MAEEKCESLPASVEEAVRHFPSLDEKSKAVLANLGEEASLQLINNLGNFADYISFMARVSASLASTDHDATVASVSPPPLKTTATNSSSSEEEMLDSLSLEEQNRNRSRSSIPKSPQLEALGELEFRKAFLILSYSGRKKLEDVITVDTIQRIKDLPMPLFESELWRVLGHKCIPGSDRQKKLDWDSGRTHIYYCHVNPDGTYFFKGPCLNKQNTHLHRVLGDDRVLLVKFAEEVSERNKSAVSSKLSYAGYQKIAKDGILVGLRRYRFFVFKDGGKEEKKKSPTSSPVKCYFVCFESDAPFDKNKPYILLEKSVHEARCVFMHVHMVSTLAKYMARFSLILSKTVKLEVDLSSVHIERIEDKPCQDEDGHIIYGGDGEALIHTDGTGFISEDLALKCPWNVHGGNCLVQREFERSPDRVEHVVRSSELTNAEYCIFGPVGTPPLLIQGRLFYNGLAVKGTFLLNRKLPPRTIQIRPSMIKVERDPKLTYLHSANSFEIVSTSNKPRKTSCLSRYLIAFLNYGGVPKDYFLGLLMNALEVAQDAHYNIRSALTVSVKYGEMDDFLLPRMILCGIPLDEPYLRNRLSVLMREEWKGLKGGKLPINECYYLMGTADPTGLLNNDEVCVILGDGQISGKVLVYKHPGLHFGDIHVLNATYVKELEKFVGNAKYAIFFPTKGPRSVADEIANSDFDGDMYWVSRNPQLLESYKPSKPWTRSYSTKSVSQRKPIHYSSEERENELWQQFLITRFHPSNNTSSAADSWLAFMDRILTIRNAKEKCFLEEKMLRLVDIYYDALDAPKTGKKVDIPKELKAEKFPHFMERSNSYMSKSILGQIYDTVDSFKTTEEKPEEVWRLPCFRREVPTACLKLWEGYYEVYRDEMSQAMELDGDSKDESANAIIMKYKQILYGGKEFEQSARKIEDIFNEARAIYQITYDYAEKYGVGRCNFAWRVAGRALCTLYVTNPDDNDVILCSKSVLHEVLN